MDPEETETGGETETGAPPGVGSQQEGAPPDGAGTEPEKPVIGAGGNKLEGEALSARLARERKKTLIDLFGTDDPEQIRKLRKQHEETAKKLKEQDEHLARYRRGEEARKRARMSETDRLRTDLAAKDARIQELEEQIKNQSQQFSVSKQDAMISATAARFVDPEYIIYARRDLAAELTELSEQDPEALKKFDGKALEKWFERYVTKSRPAFALKREQASTDPKPPERRRITTGTGKGTPAPRRANVAGGAMNEQGKTVKPGPNAMTNAEYREYKRKQGIRV